MKYHITCYIEVNFLFSYSFIIVGENLNCNLAKIKENIIYTEIFIFNIKCIFIRLHKLIDKILHKI